MWGTVMEGNQVNLAHFNAKTIPKNPVDAGVVPIFEDHADEVTFIPESHVDDEIIHVRMGMLTRVHIPQRSDVPITQLWTP